MGQSRWCKTAPTRNCLKSRYTSLDSLLCFHCCRTREEIVRTLPGAGRSLPHHANLILIKEDYDSEKPSPFHNFQNLQEYRVQMGLPNPDAKYSFSWRKNQDGTYICQSSTSRNYERHDEVTMNGLTTIEVFESNERTKYTPEDNMERLDLA